MTTSKTKMATLTERAQEIKAGRVAAREAELATNIAKTKRDAIPYLTKFFELDFTNDMLRVEANGPYDPSPQVFFEVEDWRFCWENEWLESWGHYTPTLRVWDTRVKKGIWLEVISLGDLADVPKSEAQRSTLRSRLFGRRAKNKS